MFSVIRFSEFSTIEQLHRTGAEVNRLLPGLFSGPDHRVKNRFSCAISKDDDWDTHCRGVEELISTLSAVIGNSVKHGIHVEVDMAIEPEDYSDRFLTEFPMQESLLKTLVATNAAFRISLYGNGPH